MNSQSYSYAPANSHKIFMICANDHKNVPPSKIILPHCGAQSTPDKSGFEIPENH